MKKALFLAACCLPITACNINIPFFKSLKPAQVCGGVPTDCQPTSSRKYVDVDSLDYRGPQSHLGRKYGNSIFETRQCVTEPVKQTDFVIAGENSLSGTLKKDGRSGFSAKASAELDASLRNAIGGLSEDVEASAKAELSRIVENASISEIDLNYFRIDLTQAFMDRNLDMCLSSMENGESVITGVSVIETSGTWSSSRVAEFVAAFESSAAYNSLSAEAKADWQSKTDLALQGAFKPVRYIFAAAIREK